MRFIFRLLPLFFLIASLPVGCIDLSWEPPPPGAVMAECASPHKDVDARVIATNVQGTYSFEVRNRKTGSLLAKQTISAPVGYHLHMVTLTWRQDGRMVSATIDHDFGSDNKVFDLMVPSMSPNP